MRKYSPSVSVPSLRHSPEFWTGWVLAYYQWYTCRPFSEITSVMPVSAMRDLYGTLHEADLMRFVETMEAQMIPRNTNLEILRKKANLSQSELAAMSGVSLRSIQMYEQRQSDISHAQFNTLNAMARVLNCSVYDLMDNHFGPYSSGGISQGTFMQQLVNQSTLYRPPFGVMDARQIQWQAQMDAYRTGYVAQFPVEQLSMQSNGYSISQATFIDNWNCYWTQVIEQQRLNDIDRENRNKMIHKLAKEAIGQGLKSSGNHATAMAFDAMCAITADNVAEAVSKVISVIAAMGN